MSSSMLRRVALLILPTLSLASWMICHKCRGRVSPRLFKEQNSPSVTVPEPKITDHQYISYFNYNQFNVTTVCRPEIFSKGCWLLKDFLFTFSISTGWTLFAVFWSWTSDVNQINLKNKELDNVLWPVGNYYTMMRFDIIGCKSYAITQFIDKMHISFKIAQILL